MKKTRNHGGRENVEHDLISSLPDEVLTHILSFLITKEAVQTCVLSKSWKTTWATVPILNIKPKDFVEFEDYYCSNFVDCYEGCNEVSRMAVARFERFMTGFLDNRAPTNLQRVCCHRGFHRWETHAFIGWLDRVLLLMPLQINIIISCYGDISVDMPDLVFSSACLQHLSMSLYTNVKIIIRPVSINLPSLKFLQLNCIELPDDFSQKLFMGCPSLERLTLCHCELYFSSISSQVLKELTLNSCDLHEQMQISCPNLVFMRINVESGGISLKNMSSLVDVVIILYQDLRSAEVPVLNFFGCLSNVVKLELRLETLVLKEQSEKDISNCRNFNNLKKLVVAGKWDMSHDFYLIACLLKHSPNLKELCLLLSNESQWETQEPPQEVSGGVLFQHEYLETVKIGHMYMGILSGELIDAMIKLLGSYVKKIGNVIITDWECDNNVVRYYLS